MIDFPNIDPVAFRIGDIAIRWYGLAYVAGILCFFPYVRFLAYERKIPLKPGEVTFRAFSDVAPPVILGGIVGARLLDFIFYNPQVLISEPLAVFRIWEGGMSVHGGLIGGWLSLFIYVKLKKKIFGRRMPFLFCTDLAATYIPLFMFVGRLANFINGELYGRQTQVPWAMVFPAGGNVPRHPSQIYEAFTEGLVIFAVIAFFVWRKNVLLSDKHGFCTGLLLAMYGAFRFMVEWFRESEFLFYWLTMGQVLSLVSLGAGLVLLWIVHFRKHY